MSSRSIAPRRSGFTATSEKDRANGVPVWILVTGLPRADGGFLIFDRNDMHSKFRLQIAATRARILAICNGRSKRFVWGLPAPESQIGLNP
jgi:hypothetical protein